MTAKDEFSKRLRTAMKTAASLAAAALLAVSAAARAFTGLLSTGRRR
ncbi:MAG: hypothetical protein M3N82_05785 [Pseudomonadota bacterium]|nr:hypothetical protein [Pseudomonadota bacterium]